MIIPSTRGCAGFPKHVFNSEQVWWDFTLFVFNVVTVHGVTIINRTAMFGSHYCNDPVVVS